MVLFRPDGLKLTFGLNALYPHSAIDANDILQNEITSAGTASNHLANSGEVLTDNIAINSKMAILGDIEFYFTNISF